MTFDARLFSSSKICFNEWQINYIAFLLEPVTFVPTKSVYFLLRGLYSGWKKVD